jgi:hypothetical protein
MTASFLSLITLSFVAASVAYSVVKYVTTKQTNKQTNHCNNMLGGRPVYLHTTYKKIGFKVT